MGSHDFLGHLFATIREYYLPHHDFKMITFLVGLLTNSLSWVKVQTMRILCIALPEIDMRNPELAGHGSDLISPLLRLLQTEFCMEALEVLDNIMAMSGSHMDKHHLRMSMTRSTSKAIRKEYERTQSLFGIPEASGWAIPIPAKKTDATRANIHAAFYMCQGPEGASPDATPTAGVEFQIEEIPYDYFDVNRERAADMMSDITREENHPIGDLVTKLDSLDDFFDEPASPTTDDSRESSRTITEFTPESFETGTQLYDEQILPILHEASTSNTSFQNGFADRPYRDNTMNPGAFSASMPSGRPPLHSRSITSPSLPHANNLSDVVSDDEDASGGLSDDDQPESSRRDKVAALENMVRPQSQMSRPTLRRLASRSRSRDIPPVPNLPTDRTM